VGDAIVSTDPVEQHFGAFAEAIGELFAVEFLMAVKPHWGS
jgi:hypothetical protein